LALKNNPETSVGHLLALAQHQIYREARDLRQLPNSSHGSLIWGKMGGAKSGSSGHRK